MALPRLVLTLTLALLAGCGGGAPSTYPVGGSVRVNGAAAPLMRVQFLHADPAVTGNARMPVAVTDDAGNFRLSTSGDADGAVPGDYAVTFEWLSENDIAAYDRLGGALADAKKTTFRAKVEARPNTLAPFEITVPASALVTKPPRAR